MTDKCTILIAGIGTSPVVFTETVWALCHQKKPMVPEEIVVLVTKSGNEPIQAVREEGRPGDGGADALDGGDELQGELCSTQEALRNVRRR